MCHVSVDATTSSAVVVVVETMKHMGAYGAYNHMTLNAKEITNSSGSMNTERAHTHT